MHCINDISYAPDNGFRGSGDLFLPDEPSGKPAALVIHGGGWNAMDKKSITPVSLLLVECGYAVFSVNYRLLDNAPWPACGEDCLAAAKFLLNSIHPTMKRLDCSSILIAGASAGGHLAMWTGLHLVPEKVRAILSIAGPSDLALYFENPQKWEDSRKKFFGKEEVTEQDLLSASPVHSVRPGAPPLLCIHSTNDKLVPIEHSRRIVGRYREAGSRAFLASFPGKGDLHGIWEEQDEQGGKKDLSERVLVPQVKTAVREFLRTL